MLLRYWQLHLNKYFDSWAVLEIHPSVADTSFLWHCQEYVTICCLQKSNFRWFGPLNGWLVAKNYPSRAILRIISTECWSMAMKQTSKVTCWCLWRKISTESSTAVKIRQFKGTVQRKFNRDRTLHHLIGFASRMSTGTFFSNFIHLPPCALLVKPFSVILYKKVS
jgi:hypothetical protein